MHTPQALPAWCIAIYKRLTRVLALDVTYVLLRSVPEKYQPQNPASNDLVSNGKVYALENAECRVLDKDALSHAAKDERFSVTESTLEMIAQESYTTIGLFHEDTLVGLSFFATGEIEPKHNRGGTSFKGIGLHLPENVCYQFKVFVLPEFRGQGANTRMIDFVLTTYANGPVDTIITTTDIANVGFLSSVTRRSFNRVGLAGEWVLFGKSFYWLPKRLFVDKNRTQFVKMFGH